MEVTYESIVEYAVSGMFSSLGRSALVRLLSIEGVTLEDG
jgi:hypothetical protein